MPWKYDPNATNGQHETSPIPTTDLSAVNSASANTTGSSMRTSRIPTTSAPDQLFRELQQGAQQAAADAQNRLGEFRLVDVRAGSHLPREGK